MKAIKVGTWTLLGIALAALYVLGIGWGTWARTGSDFQRLNSLEIRVQAIEERAGSCEVVPLP